MRLIAPRLQLVEAEPRPSVNDRQTLFSRVAQIAESIEDLYQMSHMEIFRYRMADARMDQLAEQR